LIVKLHKAVKKSFQPITPPSNRTVIDHAIYACCLENSTAEEADESLAKLQENYFDWNEVRVTTDRELATTVKSLTDPLQAATRVKKMLYGIFETYYQFDLEFLKKENLGKAVQAFDKMVGVTPFAISYISQHGLGGHSIPTVRRSLDSNRQSVTELDACSGNHFRRRSCQRKNPWTRTCHPQGQRDRVLIIGTPVGGGVSQDAF